MTANRSFLFFVVCNLFTVCFCAVCSAQTVKIDSKTPADIVLAEAEKDNPDALLEIAYRYSKGSNGCKEDKKKAFEWYEKAAKQGNENAAEKMKLYKETERLEQKLFAEETERKEEEMKKKKEKAVFT